MNCVKCDGKLQHLRAGGCTIDRCDTCAGIWFDARELGKVIEHVRAAAFEPLSDTGVLAEHGSGADYRGAGDTDKSDGQCPRCNLPLERTEVLAFEGLFYDRCASCGGAWLDSGELKQIATDNDASAEMSFFTKQR